MRDAAGPNHPSDQLAVSDNVSTAGINPVLAELPVQSTLRGLGKSTVQVPLIPKAASHEAQAAEPVSDYLRQQLERRGYQLLLERRYVFARLPSGQQVAVPIEQYSVKHVPPQIN
jgi:hypothetical protein